MNYFFKRKLRYLQAFVPVLCAAVFVAGCSANKFYSVKTEEGYHTGERSGKCSNCGLRVSYGATVCPYCGARFSNPYLEVPTVRTVTFKTFDQQTLADIAKSGAQLYVCQAALKNITDQPLLADVAKNARNYVARLGAIYKITDKASVSAVTFTREGQQKLADFAGDTEMSKDMIKTFTKEGREEPAIPENSIEIRELALSYINDQSIIARVAKNAVYDAIRQDAVEKLYLEPALADIAKNDKEIHVRMAAVDKITSQKILADIARNNKDPDTRRYAILKLTDKDTLVYIATHDKDKLKARKAAAEKITDVTLLPEINKLNNEFMVFKPWVSNWYTLSVSSINFYESGTDVVDKSQRVYKTEFISAQTRYINWELNLEYKDPASRVDFDIEAVWSDSSGREIARQTLKAYISEGWTSSWHNLSWGGKEPGVAWKPETYLVELRTNGMHIARVSFKVI